MVKQMEGAPSVSVDRSVINVLKKVDQQPGIQEVNILKDSIFPHGATCETFCVETSVIDFTCQNLRSHSDNQADDEKGGEDAS